MKKKLFFALLVLILSSCSLFFQKEYGTITIDLEGGRARSINSSTGLPNLADSELEIDILTEGSSSIYKKILASEPKFFQADFPVGSRLEITVKLNGPSSSWSAYNNHTVKEGNNDIRLLLNKNASSLANVGFSTTATNTYEFNIAGEKIDIISRELPVFTRDSRGRLYIAYKQSN
jgi:53 kDa membrane antigen A